MDQREHRLIQEMRSFTYDVHRATASLMFVLQGMQYVRDRELSKYDVLPPLHQQELVVCPRLSYIDMELWLSGAPFDPHDVLRQEGEAEQLAFQGWVEKIFNMLWEGRYRRELKKLFEGSRVIAPELDPLGDLRRLRNDLVHKKAVATREGSGKCVVLKWFKPDDPMIFRMWHVFDFLNHMGMLSDTPAVTPEGAVSRWSKSNRSEADLRYGPVPEIVSLRVSIDRHFEDGSSNHVVSLVFANGIFANVPVHYPADGTTVAEHVKLMGHTCVDSDGNVLFGKGQVVGRHILYAQAIDVLFSRGQRIEGAGIPGSWVRFQGPETPKS